MKQAVVTIKYDEEKLNAVKQYMGKKDADFDVHIKSFKKIYSNLEEIGKGHFAGKSNGATLVSGLYTSTEKHGVRIVYPPLIGWSDENLDTVAKAAVKGGYGESQIFITPNMNRQDDALSKEQIITRNYFETVKDLAFYRNQGGYWGKE